MFPSGLNRSRRRPCAAVRRRGGPCQRFVNASADPASHGRLRAQPPAGRKRVLSGTDATVRTREQTMIRGLITRRSLVQIQPPPPIMPGQRLCSVETATSVALTCQRFVNVANGVGARRQAWALVGWAARGSVQVALRGGSSRLRRAQLATTEAFLRIREQLRAHGSVGVVGRKPDEFAMWAIPVTGSRRPSPSLFGPQRGSERRTPPRPPTRCKPARPFPRTRR